MITKRDVQLGKIALRVGMVSKEQLAKSIAIQKKLDKKVGLGAIWLKKGFVNKDQLEEIVKIHNTEKGGGNGTSGKKKKKKKKPGEASESTSDAASTSEAASASEAPASESELGSVAGADDASQKNGASSAETPVEKKTSKTSAALKKDETSSAEAPVEKKTSKTSAALKKDETSSAEAPAEKKNSRTSAALKTDETSSAEAPAEKKTSKTSTALKKDDAKKDDAKKDEKDEKSEASSDEVSADRKSARSSAVKEKEKGKTGKFEKKPRDGSNDSEVDAALFESVMADESSQEVDAGRRVIACSECKKKYRVKKKQAGKRFGCRNCGEKVRVPADLFERPAKGDKAEKADKPKSDKSAKNKKVEGGVEEFSLSGAEDDSDDASAKSEKSEKSEKAEKPPSGKSPAPAAKEAGKSGPLKKDPGKSGANPAVAAGAAKEPMSIAELAKAAEKRQQAPLGPKISGKKLAGLYLQGALFILLAALIGAGIFYWKWAEGEEIKRRHLKAVDDERELFLAHYDPAVKSAREMLDKVKASPATVEMLPELQLAISQIRDARMSVRVLMPLKEGEVALQFAPPVTIQQPENTLFAVKHDEEVKGAALEHDLVLAHGQVELGLGGQKFLADAAREFQTLIDLDKKNPDPQAQALFGETELLRRNYKVAIDSLKRSQAAAPTPKTRAWLGLAYESGDVQREAIPTYDALAQSEPLAKVLKARAQLADGDADQALTEATDAVGKLGNDGEPLGAAQAMRGLILERKGDASGADKAFDASVAAGGESGRGYVARGEHHLRMGQFAEAVKDFDAAIKAAGGARAALGLGDAKAGLLDNDGARTAWNQAKDLPVKRSAALLVGEIDAFDDPHAPDPRALALRRIADLSFAAGRLDDAHAIYNTAIQKDAFDPEAFAALARVEVKQKDGASAEAHARQARILLTSANDRPGAGEEIPLLRGAATARVLMIEAIVWQDRGNLIAAEKSINGALAADSLAAGAFAFALKARILHGRADETGAKNEYMKSLELEESAKDLGTQFYNQAKTDFPAAAKSQDAAALAKVRNEINAALNLLPNHAHALTLRARLAIVEKRWGDAQADLATAIDLNIFIREAYIVRGFLYVRDMPDRGDDQTVLKATNDFGFALSIDSAAGDKKADVYYGRALCEASQNLTNPALEDLKRAIELEPTWAAPFKTRAEIYRKNSRDAEAAADTKRYEELKKLGDDH